MMTMTFGSDLNKNISYGIRRPTNLSAFRQVDIPGLKDLTTAPLVQRMHLDVRSSRSIWTFALKQASMWKVSILRWPLANGNFKSFLKVLKLLVTRYGLHGISWKELPKNTGLLLTGIVNHSALLTGTGRECMQTFPTTCCAHVVQKKSMIPYAKPLLPM